MPVITPGAGLHVSRRAKRRREFLHRNLGERAATVLEFGALDNPTFLKDEGGVHFADFFTREESVARHLDNAYHTADLIVPVDVVLRDASLREAVRGAMPPPDLVIANHVAEHVPNPIGWLQDIREVAADGALFFLSLPDRRWTFDCHRRLDDAVDWLRAHEEGAVKPSLYQVLRHIYYETPIREEDAWAGAIPDDHLHCFGLKGALERARELEAEYTDVHCWVFTSDSFRRLFAEVSETGLIPWRLRVLEDVVEGENEFRVLLEAA